MGKLKEFEKKFQENNFKLTKNFIENNIFNKSGSLDANKVRFLNKNFNISNQEIYNVYYDLKEIPKCSICANNCKFLNFKKGYNKTCGSKKCIGKQRYINAKNTFKEKYNVENPSQLDSVNEKKKKTYLKHFGFEHPMKNESFKENLLEKVKKTNIKKYGVDFPVKSEKIRKKIENNLKKDFGINHHSQKHINDFKNFKNKNFIIENFIKNEKFLIDKFCEYFNVHKSKANAIKQELNILIPNNSNIENKINKIFNFIFKEKDRSVIKPFELDLFSKNHKIAIEYDGLLWHSFGKSTYPRFNNYNEIDKNYHLRKTELCETQGIQLLHIFEDEWLNETKRKIWISVIKSKLGIIKDKIYARKCIIKEIDTKIAKKFLNENHLQGYVNSSIKLGLYYDNNLVSVMTIGKSRYSKKYQYELLRFANKINTSVIGAFSKLLKYFERKYNPKNIISYANRRWSNGNVYEVNRFSLVNISGPNYFYFKPDEGILQSRVKFQKHKLKNLLENYDPKKTELQNMIDNGYRIMYDCGNKVYLKEF